MLIVNECIPKIIKTVCVIGFLVILNYDSIYTLPTNNECSNTLQILNLPQINLFKEREWP